MEVVVSVMAGVLAAVCAWLAAPLLAGAGRRAYPATGSAVVDVAQAVGSWLPEGLVRHGQVRTLGREVFVCIAPRFGVAEEACRVPVRAGMGFIILLSGAGALVGLALSLSPLGALVGLCVPPAAVVAMASRTRRAELGEIEAAMPEAFEALSISLGSGYSLSQAMRFVGTHAAEPIKSEFLRVSFAIDCGASAADALDGMLERLQAPGLELVSLALRISQRTGAPLKDLLADAAAAAGERIELARTLDVKTSQARMSARLVALMPVVMCGALTLISADFREGVCSVGGLFSVIVAFALDLAAWMIIRRMMEVDV